MLNVVLKAATETFASVYPVYLATPTSLVNPNASPIQIVQTVWPALLRNVKTLVLELAELMLNVKSSDTILSVRVLTVTRAIHLSVANPDRLSSNRLSSQNAKSILIVKQPRHVLNSVALTHVSSGLVFALLTPNAELSNIVLFASALRDSLATLKFSVFKVILSKNTFTYITCNIFFIFNSVGCRSDSDCPSAEACVNRQCKDPCVFETCGTNAICRVNVHRPQCFCPERHEGDPYRACRLPECLVDEDCPSSLACREKNCRDPCNCPPNTKCTVINHVPRCSCPPGYKGEPNTTQGCFLPGIHY